MKGLFRLGKPAAALHYCTLFC